MASFVKCKLKFRVILILTLFLVCPFYPKSTIAFSISSESYQVAHEKDFYKKNHTNYQSFAKFSFDEEEQPYISTNITENKLSNYSQNDFVVLDSEGRLYIQNSHSLHKDTQKLSNFFQRIALRPVKAEFNESHLFLTLAALLEKEKKSTNPSGVRTLTASAFSPSEKALIIIIVISVTLITALLISPQNNNLKCQKSVK